MASLVGGVIGGVIGGVVGAAVWAGVSYATGYEIGWIAWGIGGLVGLGVAWGDKGASGHLAGIVAVIISLCAILAGKYAAVQFVIDKHLTADSLAGEMTAAIETDEFMRSYVADRVVEKYEAAGKPVNWPEGMSVEEATVEAEYPPDVWADATARWEAMSDSERGDYRQQVRDTMTADLAQAISGFRGDMIAEGFKQSFSAMDVIFFLLAVVTAFKIASSRTVANAEA